MGDKIFEDKLTLIKEIEDDVLDDDFSSNFDELHLKEILYLHRKELELMVLMSDTLTQTEKIDYLQYTK